VTKSLTKVGVYRGKRHCRWDLLLRRAAMKHCDKAWLGYEVQWEKDENEALKENNGFPPDLHQAVVGYSSSACSVRQNLRFASHVTRHTSHVTRHTSHATRHTSHVKRHTSHVTRHIHNYKNQPDPQLQNSWKIRSCCTSKRHTLFVSQVNRNKRRTPLHSQRERFVVTIDVIDGFRHTINRHNGQDGAW
jgi:hypothetical protein